MCVTLGMLRGGRRGRLRADLIFRIHTLQLRLSPAPVERLLTYPCHGIPRSPA